MEKKEKKKGLKSPYGRNLIPIDWKVVGDMSKIGCSGREIAAYLDISSDTLFDRCVIDNGITYAAFSSKYKELGNFPIRAKMYQKGVKEGNMTALLHLAKHRLGEWDVKEQDQEAPMQPSIDKDHENMALQARIDELLDKIQIIENNANKCQAE